MASVCIIMGSKSDEEKVAPCAEVLKKLGIGFFMTVSSAHRTPERTEKIVREQEASGCRVFICAAGMAAHLAGAAAILLNWGILDGNYPYLNTPVLKSIFVRGAQRNPALTYPNREFGYGMLDLYEAFLRLRNL